LERNVFFLALAYFGMSSSSIFCSIYLIYFILDSWWILFFYGNWELAGCGIFNGEIVKGGNKRERFLKC
jgi:hypothetical protein